MTWPWQGWPLTSVSWDAGIRWHVAQVTPPTDWPVTAEFVRDQHLRSPNGVADLDYIDHCIRAATLRGERFTRRSFMPQTLAQVLSTFPSGAIVLDRPPLLEVVSITYVDEAGDTQTLDAAEYQVSAPQGPMAGRGQVLTVSGGSWPSIDSGAMAPVTVTYRAGYEDGNSPAQANVPEDITHGILLVIGELYKSRSESNSGVSPAILRAKDLWMPYRVFP